MNDLPVMIGELDVGGEAILKRVARRRKRPDAR
jgi:hypothetical protein